MMWFAPTPLIGLSFNYAKRTGMKVGESNYVFRLEKCLQWAFPGFLHFYQCPGRFVSSQHQWGKYVLSPTSEFARTFPAFSPRHGILRQPRGCGQNWNSQDSCLPIADQSTVEETQVANIDIQPANLYRGTHKNKEWGLFAESIVGQIEFLDDVILR